MGLNQPAEQSRNSISPNQTIVFKFAYIEQSKTSNMTDNKIPDTQAAACFLKDDPLTA